MISGIRHAWDLLASLSAGEWLHLAEWHEWVVLAVLALMAGLGAHYLLGYVFRFYWRGGRFQWWIAILAMPVLVLSVFALTGMYLLGVGSPRLIDSILQSAPEDRPGLTAEVGAYLLEPALAHAERGSEVPGPTRMELQQALSAMSSEQLREALGGEREESAAEAAPPPAASPQTAPPPGEPAPRLVPGDQDSEAESEPAPASPNSTEVILRIVKDWVTDPNQTFPGDAESAKEGEAPATPPAPPTLAAYLIDLIGEVSPDAALDSGDWTLIAGTRFAEQLLRSLLLEYLQSSALAGTVLILLLNLGYFWIIQRMARGARTPAVKASTPGSPPKSVASPPKPATAPAGDGPKKEAGVG